MAGWRRRDKLQMDEIEPWAQQQRGKRLSEEGRTEMSPRRGRAEAKVGEKTGQEKAADFWAGKTPCWEICYCPQLIKDECPASKYTFLPCWEIEGTYCKLDDYGATGKDTSICELCRVYKRWGGGKPIGLKLFDKGINTTLRPVERMGEGGGAEAE